jgi:hypothetical protein
VTILFILTPEKKLGNRQSDLNLQPPYCVKCRKTDHVKSDCFILNRRNEANGNSNDYVKAGATGTTSDSVFDSVLENSDFSENILLKK